MPLSQAEFTTMLREAAEHARGWLDRKVFCVVELHPLGFCIFAARYGIKNTRVVLFDEVFTANFPLLREAIDRCAKPLAELPEKETQ